MNGLEMLWSGLNFLGLVLDKLPRVLDMPHLRHGRAQGRADKIGGPVRNSKMSLMSLKNTTPSDPN